jgi:hypothetical protein
MPGTVSRPVGALRPGDHACLTFASDVRRREAVTRFAARGLAGLQRSGWDRIPTLAVGAR